MKRLCVLLLFALCLNTQSNLIAQTTMPEGYVTSEMGCIGRWKVNTICNYEGGGWSSSLISTKKPEDSEERLILSFYPNGYYTVERQDLKTSKSDIIERGYYYEYKDGGKLYMVSSFGENIEYKY